MGLECKKCGQEKKGAYVKESMCSSCMSEYRKERRAQARLAKGKSPWSHDGRSPLCSKCKKEKEPGRDNESYCKACKSEAKSKRIAQKRVESGLRPWGSGPNPICSCGAQKERIDASECNECHRKRDNEWRLRTGRTKRHRTGLCRCGKPFASYSNCYCPGCASAWRKKYLEDNPEKRSALYKKANERKYESFDEYIKYWARYSVSNAIKRGVLIKMPCEKCTTTENVEAHHEDYSRPLDVRWLCKQHHSEEHMNLITE